jgi:hypothetical protein
MREGNTITENGNGEGFLVFASSRITKNLDMRGFRFLPLFTRIANKSTEFKLKAYKRHIDYSNRSLFSSNNNSKYKHIKDIYTIQVGVYNKNRYECCVGRNTTHLQTEFCIQNVNTSVRQSLS